MMIHSMMNQMGNNTQQHSSMLNLLGSSQNLPSHSGSNGVFINSGIPSQLETNSFCKQDHDGSGNQFLSLLSADGHAGNVGAASLLLLDESPSSPHLLREATNELGSQSVFTSFVLEQLTFAPQNNAATGVSNFVNTYQASNNSSSPRKRLHKKLENTDFDLATDSSRTDLQSVRAMFPNPEQRVCVVCKRSNMSFKKNYFVHDKNIDMYRETFPLLRDTIQYGPVCSTDFNKVWRFSRGEYAPANSKIIRRELADGEEKKARKRKSASTGSLNIDVGNSDKTTNVKKKKQKAHVKSGSSSSSSTADLSSESPGNTVVLVNYESNTNAEKKVLTLMNVDRAIFANFQIGQFTNKLKQELVHSHREAVKYKIENDRLPTVLINENDILSIKLKKDHSLEQFEVDEQLLTQIYLLNTLSFHSGDTLLVTLA